MKRKRIGMSLLASLGLVAMIVVVVASLSSTPTAARPDCGPSYVWDCTLPNGSHKVVGGTRCDIATYQRKTGAHCVPSGL